MVGLSEVLEDEVVLSLEEGLMVNAADSCFVSCRIACMIVIGEGWEWRRKLVKPKDLISTAEWSRGFSLCLGISESGDSFQVGCRDHKSSSNHTTTQ